METRPVADNFGPWMLVKRKFRKGSAQKGKSQQIDRDLDPNKKFVQLDSLESMEDEIAVNGEVIAACNKGVREDSARLSFREFKEKARKEKAIIAQDSQLVVPETQFNPVPAINAQSKNLLQASGSSSSQVRSTYTKTRVRIRSSDRAKPYSHPSHSKPGIASKKPQDQDQTVTLKETTAWLPKNTIFFFPNPNPKNLAAIFEPQHEQIALENRLAAPEQTLLEQNTQPAPKPPDVVMDEGGGNSKTLLLQDVSKGTELAEKASQNCLDLSP